MPVIANSVNFANRQLLLPAARFFVSKGMPGIGYPKWEVTLLKVRNGKPGNWKIQWRNKKFELIDQPGLIIPEEQRKIG